MRSVRSFLAVKVRQKHPLWILGLEFEFFLRIESEISGLTLAASFGCFVLSMPSRLRDVR